jgi:AcrR family transcriptional regulator
MADPVSERGSTTLGLVLTTSTELFAERGFAATTMRQLADRARLPLSTFYYYFSRKYDVLLAIMDDAMRQLEAGAAEALDERLDPSAQLVTLVESHVRMHLNSPAAAGVADAELRALLPPDRETMVARRDRYEQQFRDVLRAGVESGQFARDLDIPVAAAAILTMSTSVIDWWRPSGRYTINETARRMGEFACGIAMRPSSMPASRRKG